MLQPAGRRALRFLGLAAWPASASWPAARFLIRQPDPGDEAGYERLLLDPEVSAWLRPEPLSPFSRAEIAEMLADDLRHWRDAGFGPWVLVDREGEDAGRPGRAAPHLGRRRAGHRARLDGPPRLAGPRPGDRGGDRGPGAGALGRARRAGGAGPAGERRLAPGRREGRDALERRRGDPRRPAAPALPDRALQRRRPPRPAGSRPGRAEAASGSVFAAKSSRADPQDHRGDARARSAGRRSELRARRRRRWRRRRG